MQIGDELSLSPLHWWGTIDNWSEPTFRNKLKVFMQIDDELSLTPLHTCYEFLQRKYSFALCRSVLLYNLTSQLTYTISIENFVKFLTDLMQKSISKCTGCSTIGKSQPL